MLTCLLLAVSLAAEPSNADLALLQTFRNEFVLITPGAGKFPASNDLKEPFAIARFEVPQNLWQAVHGKNPSEWQGERNSVERMTFPEAQEFCKKVTERLRAARLIDAVQTFRLPTSA